MLATLGHKLRTLGRIKINFKLEVPEDTKRPVASGQKPADTYARHKSHTKPQQEYKQARATPPPAKEPSFLSRLFAPSPKKDTHFKVIGLDRIKRHYSAHWPQIGDKVHQIVQLVIKQNLKEGEAFTPLPPNKYIVTFGNITEEEADRRALEIKKQILDIFLQDQRLSEHMDMTVKQVDQNVSVQMLQAAGLQHPQAADSNHNSALAPEQPRKIFRDHVPTAGSSNFYTEKKFSANRPVLRLDENGKGIMPEPIIIKHIPVMIAHDKTLAGFGFYCTHEMPNGEILYEYDVLPEEAEDDMYLALDIKLLKKMIRSLTVTYQQCGHARRMVCPVHYRTIKNPETLIRYKKVCADIPDNIKEKLYLELMHMPRALYGAELERPIRILKQITPNIIVRYPIDLKGALGLSAAGAQAVGVDFSDLDPKSKKVLQTAYNFAHMAKKEKLLSYACGLNSPELVAIADQVGFTFLSGFGLPLERASDIPPNPESPCQYGLAPEVEMRSAAKKVLDS